MPLIDELLQTSEDETKKENKETKGDNYFGYSQEFMASIGADKE